MRNVERTREAGDHPREPIGNPVAVQLRAVQWAIRPQPPGQYCVPGQWAIDIPGQGILQPMA
jgi:hypothetical protein